MFSVARLRRLALAALAFAPLATSLEDTLFTSSVSYCQPPESLLIEQFDIEYFAKNASVSFNISAASVASNLNVTAHLFVNVYGMHPLNLTIDLCSLLQGALCPLPSYNFTGADSITLPSSVNVAHYLPGIAYKIPDLEAFAQLTLLEVGTGDVKACVQATLSNGWSARQPAVSWATGALALLTLLAALAQSAAPAAMAPVRLLDLLGLYQGIAASGLLALNLPSVYRSFTLNFAWALGLSQSQAIQASISATRAKTGGTMDGGAGNAVGLVNRELSPYNVNSALASVQALAARAFQRRDLDLGSFAFALSDGQSNTTQLVASAGGVQLYAPASSSVLQAGVPIYVNSLNIPSANAFMTVFLVALMVLAVALATLGLLYGVTVLVARRRSDRSRAAHFKDGFPSFARAWGLRVALVCFSPIAIFTFFQWTLKDSWVSILFSVLALLAVVAAIVIPSFRTLRFVRANKSADLWTVPFPLVSCAPLYAPYRSARALFFLAPLAAALARTLLLGFAQGHGLIQIALLLAVELCALLAILILRPHETRRGDVFAAFLASVRVGATGLMIAFVETIHVQPIPRVVIGCIVAVAYSICVIVMFVDILKHVGLFALFRRARPRAADGDSDAGSSADAEKVRSASLLEKAEAESSASVGPAPESESGRDSMSFDGRADAESHRHLAFGTPPLRPDSAASAGASVYGSAYSRASGAPSPLPARWDDARARSPPYAL